MRQTNLIRPITSKREFDEALEIASLDEIEREITESHENS